MTEQIPAGYQQTEVGVIPEDWSAPQLGEIIEATQLGGNYKNSLKPTNYPLIKMGNLSRGFINIGKIEYIQSIDLPSEKDKLCFGDVLFNTRNTLELVGKVAIWRGEISGAYFNSNIMRIKFDENYVSSNLFMNVVLNTSGVIEKFRGIATGTTSVAAIYNKDLLKVYVPLPTKKEQQAIAEALSDVDALIESLEQLIAKKRQIKQGAMQELLTGQRRLPGFSGEWKVKSLETIADIDPEQLSSKTLPEFEFKYISLEDVDFGILISHSQQIFSSAPSRARRKLRKNDVLVSTVRPNLKSHLWFKNDEQDWICSTGFSVLRFHEGIADPGYVFSHLFSENINKQIDALLTGSNYPAINSRDVRQLEIPLPEFDEQVAISAILNDLDLEVLALESRLDKARQIKQGMMQELLTGRIRLIQNP